MAPTLVGVYSLSRGHDGGQKPTFIDRPQQARSRPKAGYSRPSTPFVGGWVNPQWDPDGQIPHLPLTIPEVDLGGRKDNWHFPLAVQSVPKDDDEGEHALRRPRDQTSVI